MFWVERECAAVGGVRVAGYQWVSLLPRPAYPADPDQSPATSHWFASSLGWPQLLPLLSVRVESAELVYHSFL